MCSNSTRLSTVRWGAPARIQGFLSAPACTRCSRPVAGLSSFLVKLNDKVTAGQKVGFQRNAFGEVIAEYTSGVSGEVGAYRTDATSEPGNILVSILYNRPQPDGIDPLAE